MLSKYIKYKQKYLKAKSAAAADSATGATATSATGATVASATVASATASISTYSLWQCLRQVINLVYPTLAKEKINIICKESKNLSECHFSTNIAIILSKRFSLDTPENSAIKISAVINQGCPFYSANNNRGVLLITLNTAESIALLDNIATNSNVLVPLMETKKIIIDYSSPNIAKEMHVGHLRSTIIGESLARLLEFCHQDVSRVNHLGDWGTQFGMLITYLLEVNPNFQDAPISDLNQFYRLSKERFDQDEEFAARARQAVIKLQVGDAEMIQAWQYLVDISKASFQQIYTRLGINATPVGESFYNPIIPTVIADLESKHLVEIQNGAKFYFCRQPRFATKGDYLPLILQKSDGGYGYDSTDVAALFYRIFDEQANWIIYVTDKGQSAHFALLFKLAEAAGWDQAKLDHVDFGLVQLKTKNKVAKMKSRSGQTIKLKTLLDTAVAKFQPLGKNAELIAYSTIRYYDLKRKRKKNYVFDINQVLETKGDTAFFIIKSFSNLSKILKNKEKSFTEEVSFTQDIQWKLMIQISQFQHVIKVCVNELELSPLCSYLYRTAVVFNQFVKESPADFLDFKLCLALSIIVKHSYHLLGFTN